MYIYFKDCSTAESHKLSGVIEIRCLSLEFSGDLEESDGEVPHGNLVKYIRTIDEHLNSESIDGKFGQSDVYDSTQVIMNSHRIPGSRSKGKDNTRDGKGALREGRQRAANLADGGDQTGGDDNCQSRESFGNWEADKYQDRCDCPVRDVRYTGGSVGSPSDLDWGGIGKLWYR